jgi:hypothetical protein
MKERLAYVGWVGLCVFVGCSLIVSPDTSELGKPMGPDAEAGAPDGDAAPDASDGDSTTGDGDAQPPPEDGDAGCVPEQCPDDGDPCTRAICNPGCVNVPVNPDMDGDGYRRANSPVMGCGDDCDDTNPAINPGAAEICGNAVDENCDGTAATCPGDTCTQSPPSLTAWTRDNTQAPAVVYTLSATATFLNATEQYQDNYGNPTLSGRCRELNNPGNNRRDRVYQVVLPDPGPGFTATYRVTVQNNMGIVTPPVTAVFSLAEGESCVNNLWSTMGVCYALNAQGSIFRDFTGITSTQNRTLWLLVQSTLDFNTSPDVPFTVTVDEIAVSPSRG